MSVATVLCVDDDPVVRQVTLTALERAGYSVLSAGDGEEALALLDQWTDPVALVILDWIMPGKSGAELVAEIKSRRPEIRILLTSGYSHVAALPLLTRKQVEGFLGKPYGPKHLVDAVERLSQAPAKAMAANAQRFS